MDVFALLFITSFIALVITLAVMYIIKRIKKAQEYKQYSEDYVAEKSQDLGLADKVLSDKPKTKVLTREYDVPNKQDTQELFDIGKMSTTVDLKFNTAPPNKGATCASNETPPNHKTRVALRKKRQRKK